MELKGKTIDFLGDSITEGCCVVDLKNRFDNRLKEMCELKEVYNYGIGGSRFAHQIKPSACPRFDLCFCGRCHNLNPNADIIVVFGGVNDYLHGDAPFGKEGDNTPATFIGGTEYLMNTIPALYPNAKLVFITPAKNYFGGKAYFETSAETKNPDARVLKEYVDVILAKAKEHNIPVLNLFDNLGFDPYYDKEEFHKYLADGLHFNDDGHLILANKIKDFLESL